MYIQGGSDLVHIYNIHTDKRFPKRKTYYIKRLLYNNDTVKDLNSWIRLYCWIFCDTLYFSKPRNNVITTLTRYNLTPRTWKINEKKDRINFTWFIEHQLTNRGGRIHTAYRVTHEEWDCKNDPKNMTTLNLIFGICIKMSFNFNNLF